MTEEMDQKLKDLRFIKSCKDLLVEAKSFREYSVKVSDGVIVTDGGDGYNSAPEVIFSGGFTSNINDTWPSIESLDQYYLSQFTEDEISNPILPPASTKINLATVNMPTGRLFIQGDVTFTTNNNQDYSKSNNNECNITDYEP